MMKDLRAELEERRMAAIRELDILDSAPEADFDAIVKLAALIFKVPISTVTILDTHRQWFKAAIGMPLKETPREISFCTHAIQQVEPLVVEDTAKDQRFSKSPLVTESPKLGFYAGVPLRNSENQAIGTFCIMDTLPRALSDHELEVLKIFANQVMKLLELRFERNRLKQLMIERDRIYKDLQESEQRWKFALEGAGDGVWDWSIKSDQMFFSKRWKEMLGYSDGDEILAHYNTWLSCIHEEDVAEALQNLKDHLDKRSEGFKAEYRVLCKDNSWRWVLSRGVVVERDAEGQPSRMVGTHTDISERKETEELIWKQANFDTLTGLPNRRMFFDRLTVEIKRATRAKHIFVLMFIDLDGFKEVNDAFGHQAGDELLVEVSKRLETCIRQSDTLARLGGDEFTIILTALDNLTAVENITNKLLRVLSTPFQLGPATASISASIGVAVYPTHGDDGDSLISHADTAMYKAKARGKNCWVVFEPEAPAVAG